MRALRWDVLFLLLIPLGLAVFLVFSYQLTGDWFSYFTIQQQGWGHYLRNPFSLLWEAFHKNAYTIVQAAFAVVGVALLVVGWKQVRFSYWFYGLYSILVPLAGLGKVVEGMPRYVLVAFPIFIVLASWARNRQLDTSMTILFALLQGCFMVFWTLASYLMV
jgi:hypothetical protein